MSLDVYLESDPLKTRCVCSDCGHVHDSTYRKEYFSANITHNLAEMASEAGIYYALWRPEEVPATKAKELIDIIEKGLSDMKERPNHYKRFNVKNGWGTYDQFIPWVEAYLNACKEYPNSNISVSR